jgi:hypothetical protein
LTNMRLAGKDEAAEGCTKKSNVEPNINGATPQTTRYRHDLRGMAVDRQIFE